LRHPPARGLLWADHADALVERGGADAQLLVTPMIPRAVVLVSQASTLREGTAMLERALELSSSVTPPDELSMRTIRGNLAAAYAMQGEHARTLSILDEVIADTEREQGPHHPELASYLGNYASALVATDRLDEALTMLERALAIRVDVVGPEHLDVAGIHAALGQYLLLDGQLDEAEQHLRLALELSREHGTEIDQAEVMVRLANLQSQRERRGEARNLYREALGIFEREAPDHPFIATTMANLAEEAIVLRDWEQVLAWAGRSLAEYEQSLGLAHPQLHGPLYNMGQAHRELGQLSESVRALERSLALVGPDQPVVEADTSMQLAYTLWEQGQERPRARALAEQARARYEQAGVPDKTAAAAAWLSAHRP
ncbi:MAG: tetratricopeptide repeat protein, partial [Nannocystaceae bacterium]